MHQPYVSSLCDVGKMEPDTLSHACDSVSEAGHMLQGGSCAIWHKVTRTGEHAVMLTEGKRTPPSPINMGSFEIEHPPHAPTLCMQNPRPASPFPLFVTYYAYRHLIKLFDIF